MGISNWFGLGTEIAKPIEAVGGLYTTDKARIEVETKYQEVAQKPQMALLEVDRILSMSSNFFKSGYIPMAGWTAGFLLLCFYFPQIIISTYIWAGASFAANKVLPFPMKPDDILHLVYVMCAGGVHSLFANRK
jgi:hypothetical protein